MNREEVKAIVREVLTELLLGQQAPESQAQWVDLREAWQLLGYPSYGSLYKAVQAGLLREGKEVCDRRLPGAKIARWQVNLPQARVRLTQQAKKRRAG